MRVQRLIEILQEFVEENGDAILKVDIHRLDGSWSTCPVTDTYAYIVGRHFFPDQFSLGIREEDEEEHDDAN